MYILHCVGMTLISWLGLGMVVVIISILVMTRTSRMLGFYESMTERTLYGDEAARQKYAQMQEQFEEEKSKWGIIDWAKFAVCAIALWPEFICETANTISKNLQLIKACKIRLNAHNMSKKEAK